MRAKDKLLFILMCSCMIACLARIDRIFFKRNARFCLHFLYSNLPHNPAWDLPPLSLEQDHLLEEVLKQKFRYLAQGTRCYAFLSEDQNYVIKFHRYPSHMRLFSWLNRPLSYRFNQQRQKIKQYNTQNLHANFASYLDSYRDLQQETGVILLHINPTHNLRKTITLVDKTNAEYTVQLDDVTFILQSKAELIFPTLDRLVHDCKIEEAKQVISRIIHLMATCCQKGYIDEDADLRKNYGLLADRAIHIDVGDLIKDSTIAYRENTLSYIQERTALLREKLEVHYPELLEHYSLEMQKI